MGVQNEASSDTVPILTFGYGSRTLDEVVGVLHAHAIHFVIDVRSRPYSRFKSEFNREELEASLKLFGVQYVFFGDTLGGRPDDETCYTDGRLDYEKCRKRASYLEGIDRLRTAWQKQLCVALMCSEGKPEECHRSKLIGASLADAAIPVLHIDEKGVLVTQDAVIRRLTGGQPGLFGAPDEASTSRKRYNLPRTGSGTTDGT